MVTALFAGSFDPITNGHIDILKQGAEIFDKVIIAVAYNVNKKEFLPLDDRIKLIKKCVANIPNVEVDFFEGLTVEYAKKHNATVLLRGLRNSLDFEYENQLAQTNQALASEIKTVFLITKPENSFISSSAVKEILANNGEVKNLVPQSVYEYFSKTSY